jgi:PAT family beta-lactamase induction signal transducer AmpG
MQAASESPVQPVHRRFLTRLLALLDDTLLRRMLAFGFFSGLPLPLSIFTLQQWFTTAGVSVHAVSFTAWLGLSYTLKFLWSPLFDRFPPRWVRGLGRRRFWLLVVQPLLAGACFVLAFTDPAVNAVHTALAAGVMAFLSASQDIVIDAWRIETFPQPRQGAALAAYVWGYRTAMLVSGSGAIALSTVIGWHGAMLCMATLMAAAPLLTLFIPEPALAPARDAVVGVLAALERSFIEPLLDFLNRPGAFAVLAFIILFRLGKVFADNTAAAFYHQGLGLSSIAVAGANFLPSLIGVFSGAAFGAWLVARLGTIPAVLAAGALQAASLGLYLILLAVGTGWMLYVKVGGEAFCGAAADATFLTFVSALCSRNYTATQYALLSSLAAIPLHSLAGTAGYAAEAAGWAPFYLGTILLCLPALAIMRSKSFLLLFFKKEESLLS